MWAEKELHNLVKMSRHGLRVPDAVLLKKHVLLMSFIGKNLSFKLGFSHMISQTNHSIGLAQN